MKNKYGIGDHVRVANYGNWHYSPLPGGKWQKRDMNPKVVGTEALISEVSDVQGKPRYSLLKKDGSIIAWYFEDQLEMVNRNPNNDTFNL